MSLPHTNTHKAKGASADSLGGAFRRARKSALIAFIFAASVMAFAAEASAQQQVTWSNVDNANIFNSGVPSGTPVNFELTVTPSGPQQIDVLFGSAPNPARNATTGVITGYTFHATVTPLTEVNGKYTYTYDSPLSHDGRRLIFRARINSSSYVFSSTTGTLKIDQASKKDSKVTVDCESGPYIYNGAPHTPCTAVATNTTGTITLANSLTVSYTPNINAGTVTASASWGGNSEYNGSSGSSTFEINKAATTTTVTCGTGPFPFTGSAQTPCSANVTGPGGLNQTLQVQYSDNVNTGTATASASYAGGPNHEASSDSETFTIGKASSTVTINCPVTATTYTGSPLTPCTAKATGTGMSDVDLTSSIVYTDNVNVGTAGASVSWGGDANHTGNSASQGFEIGKASSTTTLTCPASRTYTGAAIEPCTATVTGAGGLNEAVAVVYSNNTNAGTATASATFAGENNHTGSSDSGGFTINKAESTTVVSFEAGPYVYRGSAFTATATVSGVGGLSQPVSVVYTGDCTNVTVAGCTATASYAGGTNHEASQDAKTIIITKANAAVTVSGFTGTYDGNPHGATGSATGVNNEDLSGLLDLGDSFLNANAPVGETANWSFAGNVNYNPKSGSVKIIISKAASTTTVTCQGGPFTYTGSPQTPCSASVSGPGGFNETLTVSYSDNTNAGTATANANYAGGANHEASGDSENFTINKAASTTVVTCGAGPYTYNGGTQTPCSAKVTGPGGLDLTPDPVYDDNVNAGTATASYTYAESTNHLGSSDSETFTIGKAESTTTVTCAGGPFTYTGSPHTPCTVLVTGAGGLNLSPDPVYADNVNAGTATASYNFAGDANHEESDDSETFTIGKAVTTTTVTCGAGPFSYNGAAHTPCSASVTGPGGLNEALTVSYEDNINAGTATASASYAETANYQASTDSEAFIIDKAVTTTTVTCGAGPFTYNGSPHTPCSALVTGPAGLSQALTVSYQNNTNAGTATASASYAETANYQASTDSETFIINKADQVISFGALANKIFGDAPFTVSATGGGSNNPVTFSSGMPAVCSVTAAGTVTMLKAGTCTVNANQAGNSNYNDAPQVQQSFTVIAWNLFGFYQPVDMGGVLNTVKGGSTVPLKFEIFAGSSERTSTADVQSFVVREIVCSTSAPMDEVELTTTGGTSLRYDATAGQFIQNWQTPKMAGRCYQVTMTTQDGSALTAIFKTK